jgi:hypothetical protein
MQGDAMNTALAVPYQEAPAQGVVLHNFAYAGGASAGIEWPLDRPSDYAIKHGAKALSAHLANNPLTIHGEEQWMPLSTTAQVRMCGKSDPPVLAQQIIGAQFGASEPVGVAA